MTNGRDLFISEFSPSSRELGRLDIFVDVLVKWNARINLVAAASLDDVWGRHILDSAQIFRSDLLQSESWLDLGSGGGFPGVVIALMAVERAPELSMKLVESDLRKAAFLRAVSRETSCQFEVLSDRIEAIPQQQSSVVSARALAPLCQLLEYSERHLAPNGRCLFLKGEKLDQELSDALAIWSFTYQKEKSLSHPSGTVLSIGDLRRV